MNYGIQVASSGAITGTYSGPGAIPEGWVTATAAQVASVVPGSMWSGSAVVPPAAPVLTAAQQLAAAAQALIAGGLAIASTGTPALNGTYAVNQQAQNNIQAVQLYIQTNGKFPGSSGTYAWLDAAGAPHVFPSVAEFTAFSTAVADFVADCTMIMLTGAGTLPAATATIP